jgi:hypothetical protein
MSNELKDYAKKVKEMRAAQVQFFVTRKANLKTISESWLKKAKALEKEVDEDTEKILAETKQGELM